MTRVNLSNVRQVFPSQYMRERRPENYSDTEDRTAYLLEAPVLEYHLESITQRNQTHEFEIFCRKLCERTICPNLRAHTGPDGGGDSKADTESFPVADEISALFYVGTPNAGRARWAFAFSAKETWKVKIRSDVKEIVGTGRNYDRIICVTSRFARDKDRAQLEDELSKKYNVPITIHDRSWIVKEIIENERKDIAYNYLKVGETKSDPLRLGPKGYSRKRQLEDIERSLDNFEAYQGIERQRVTEALIAAILSRKLESPRVETDGRFLRAIRLAERDGSYRQELEAKYEHIWTAYWWFDDFQFLKEFYADFETLALQSNNAIDLQLLCNLRQLLVGAVAHGHMSPDECRLDEHTAKLKLVLEQIAEEKDRPNNRLEAQLSLLLIKESQLIINEQFDELKDIWSKFADILEKAVGLGEFNADRLVSMIEAAGKLAGNDPAYNDLIEKTAKFVAERKSEAEGALTLLWRAQQLDLSDKFDIIRFIGKAVAGLSKKEYSEYLIDALVLLTCAYRSAGMLWAARGTCIFLAGALVIKGEEENDVPISFVPTMKHLAWLALELRHIPDVLFSIQLLNGALAALPLSEESKLKVNQEILELDAAFGCLLLNLEENDFRKLEKLPDILAALGLFTARAALLYLLGYTDILRTDGSFPENESDEDLTRCFSSLASQPAAQELRGPIILNSEEPQTLSTKILGMTVEINIEGDTQSILIAEAVLGSIEAFFSTAIEQRIFPHTEKLSISLFKNDKVLKPSFELDPLEMIGTLLWPSTFSSTNFENQNDIQKALAEVSGYVLAKSCVIKNLEDTIEKLFVNEGGFQRMGMVASVPNSYHRIASRNISRIDDWQEAVRKSYEVRSVRPAINHIKLKNEDQTTEEDSGKNCTISPELKDHRALIVRSVIDVHAWNQACWRGAAYAQSPNPFEPPYLAFMFENEVGAIKIFEHWRDRFGEVDENEEISIAIIRDLPQRSKHKHNYCIQITSKLPAGEDVKNDQLITTASKSIEMIPDSDVNLENFLKSYNRLKVFYLLPAILNGTRTPEFLFDLAILKKKITVKLAKDVGEHDVENMALRMIKPTINHESSI